MAGPGVRLQNVLRLARHQFRSIDWIADARQGCPADPKSGVPPVSSPIHMISRQGGERRKRIPAQVADLGQEGNTVPVTP